MTAPVEDLAAWLTAVWDEEERRLTRATNRGAWVADGLSVRHQPTGDTLARFVYPGDADHAEHWQPSAVLARIAADRKILAEHAPTGDGDCRTCCGEPYMDEYWDSETEMEMVVWNRANLAWPCPTIRLKAEQYADRPDLPEWLVERQGVEQ